MEQKALVTLTEACRAVEKAAEAIQTPPCCLDHTASGAHCILAPLPRQLWTAAHVVTMRLWCTQSLLSLYRPSHTILIHQVVSMSNKVISHQIPVLPRCGFRHVDIEQKKKFQSSQVVHTTVTISPQPKQIATPVPVAPSTSQVDTSGNDQNYIHDEPL